MSHASVTKSSFASMMQPGWKNRSKLIVVEAVSFNQVAYRLKACHS